MVCFPRYPTTLGMSYLTSLRNKFNSEKVLDVTYASKLIYLTHHSQLGLTTCPPDIQGIDQLVEKFRNSSVMDQDPSYRPKVRCARRVLQDDPRY